MPPPLQSGVVAILGVLHGAEGRASVHDAPPEDAFPANYILKTERLAVLTITSLTLDRMSPAWQLPFQC